MLDRTDRKNNDRTHGIRRQTRPRIEIIAIRRLMSGVLATLCKPELDCNSVHRQRWNMALKAYPNRNTIITV